MNPLAIPLTLLLAAAPAQKNTAAQERAKDAQTEPGSADTDANVIKNLVGTFHECVEKADAKALSNIFWPDAVIFMNGEAQTLDAFVKSEKGALKWAAEDNTGRSEGALAYVAQRATVEKAGKKHPLLLTFVLRKKGAEWRVAHLHWSEAK